MHKPLFFSSPLPPLAHFLLFLFCSVRGKTTAACGAQVGSAPLNYVVEQTSFLDPCLGSFKILSCSLDVPCAHLEDWWDLILWVSGFIRPFPRVPLLGGVVGCGGLGVCGLVVGRLLEWWFGLVPLSLSLSVSLSLSFSPPPPLFSCVGPPGLLRRRLAS